MAGFRPLVSGVIISLLFGIALYIFAVQWIVTNNPDTTILTDSKFNTTINAINSSIASLEQVSLEQKAALEADKPSAAFFFLIIRTAFSIPIAFLSTAITALGSLTTIITTEIFGTDSGSRFWIVVGVVNILIIVAFILAVMRVIRSGESER